MVELSLSFNHTEGKFTLSSEAAKRIKELITLENISDKTLKLSVKPGGCAGFKYEFNWAAIDEKGKRFEKDGAVLIISEADLRLIDGGELKYIQTLSESKFDVYNPNASSSCGCGSSFS